MSTLLAATQAPGGGAPLDQLAIIGGATTLLTVLTLWLVTAYRRGGAPALRRLERGTERAIGVPGWAALPGVAAVVCATVIIIGATWDIGLHIDLGRDEGPLGTTAHYPLLLGLFGAFLMGVLAVGMTPADPRRSSSVAFQVRGVGAVPAAAALLLAGATLGMSAFPLDDVWHRIFGQDVTLWGPTHVMIIGGTLTAGIGGVLLLAEGARAAGREPFGAGVGRMAHLLERRAGALAQAVGSPPGQRERSPERLSPVGERGVHQGDDRDRRGGRAPDQLQQRRVHVRLGVEDGAGNPAQHADLT